MNVKNSQIYLMPGITLAAHPGLSLLATMFGGFWRQRLTILIYHRVVENPDPIRHGELLAEEFEWHMSVLRNYLTPLSLREALDLLKEGKLPPRAICVTFDDGYADNEEVALPILQRCNVPATFFVSTGFLDGGIMWNDMVIEAVGRYQQKEMDLTTRGLGIYPTATISDKKRAFEKIINKLKYLEVNERREHANYLRELVDGLPTNLMMTKEQVRNLHSVGMDIGGHTVTHPILARLGDEEAMREIATGKEQLEEIIGASIDLFAYPNGMPGQDYNERDVALVAKAGFKTAVSTHWGVSNRNTDRMQLPRFTPWDRTPFRFLFRLGKNCFSAEPKNNG